MLPRLIGGHPYFHDTDEYQAKMLLNYSSENEGNFLFCKGDKSNEFILICKGMAGNDLILKTFNCVYQADFFGSRLLNCGIDFRVFSGLHDIVHCVASFRLPCYLNKIMPDFIFSPNPIFNSMVQNRLKSECVTDLMPPLPNDVVGTIVQHLDMQLLRAISTISKSWCTLFNKNILTVVQKREHIEADKISKDQARIEFESEYYLLNRYRSNSMLE